MVSAPLLTHRHRRGSDDAGLNLGRFLLMRFQPAPDAGKIHVDSAVTAAATFVCLFEVVCAEQQKKKLQ